MSYLYVNNRNLILRASDLKVIAPTEDITDPDVIEYQAWLDAGNQPALVEPEDVGVE